MSSPPILFLVFNRPEVTARVFAEIRAAKPSKLYVAGDGSRQDIGQDEIEKVRMTRAVITNNIDWKCEIKTLFRSENLGCCHSVSKAIDWFFDNEEEGIILEDDCFPDQSFFGFSRELLELYRDDDRIMCITGGNFQNGLKRGEYSYYFSRIPHCWGWASWKQAWQKMRPALNNFADIMKENSLKKFTCNPNANHMWTRKFSKAHGREIDSWAYLWTFANFVNHGLTVSPNVNLIENIGFDSDSTHTKTPSEYVCVKRGRMEFPLSHPPYVCPDKDADNFDYRHHFNLHPVLYRPLSCLADLKSYIFRILQ